jgi:hypothetical protein
MQKRGGSIGPYSILRRFSRGDTAHVFLAQREGSTTLVALKTLAADHQSEEQRARFAARAGLAQKLHHPHIVETLEVVHHTSREVGIAMELLHGETLHDLIRLVHPQRRMPAALALEIVRGLADALHQIHELGAVHGDVCPANVMLTYGGRVVLIDLGGSCEGIMTYASPEQARGQAVDRRSDVFSLGLILFELLTGQRVRRRSQGIEIAAEAASGTVPSLSMLVMTDPDLEQVVMRAVAHDPSRRYATAIELADALGRYRERAVPSFELESTLRAYVESVAGHRARPLRGTPPLGKVDLGAFAPLGDADPADAVDRMLRAPAPRAVPFVEPLPAPVDGGWSTERTHSNVGDVAPPKERPIWAISIGVSLLLSALMIAAVTLWPSSARTLKLDSEPRQAKVFLDGRLVGETPVELEVEIDRSFHVVMDREGYRRLEARIPVGDEPVHLEGKLEAKR